MRSDIKSIKILGFETSNSKCSVAISSGPDLLTAFAAQERGMQAESLMPLIERALKGSRLKINDIDYLAVTKGPGSFTGIRIGLASASGIIAASKIKPIVLSNFETINFRARRQVKNFDYSVCLIDAWREQVYVQIFNRSGVCVSQPTIMDGASLSDYLKQRDGKLVISGSGLRYIREPEARYIMLPRFPYPDARIVCYLALEKATLGSASDILEPLYIRPPDAKTNTTLA